MAEPESEYGGPFAEEPSSDLEIPSHLLSNAVVSRADLRLRSGENGAVRKEALAAVEEIMAADPERIYPRLVLDLHDRDRHRQLAAEAEAFSHAYPLRFLAARVADTPETWNRLLSDFGEHRPVTLLGRLVAGNGASDPADAARLAAWVEEQNGSRRGFEAFTADRLRGWLGDAPAEAEAGELLRRLIRRREGIEMLLGDALRRAADPEIYAA